MKFFVVLISLLVGTAYADGSRHMIEFNADSILLAKFALNSSKTNGRDSSSDTQATLSGGYAYSLLSKPQLQLGGRVNYTKATAANDVENYGFEVGAIWNFTPDLLNSFYTSIYTGLQWNHTYGNQKTTDENRLLTLAAGKRFSLDRFGIKHLTYSPEIAFANQNSSTNSNVEYSQSLEFRVLQFSVLF
jgi:hypothetical protein